MSVVKTTGSHLEIAQWSALREKETMLDLIQAHVLAIQDSLDPTVILVAMKIVIVVTRTILKSV